MTDPRRTRLDQLTAQWRARHEARVARGELTAADPEREAKADAFFPWRTETPAEYAARFGAAMTGYTYDAYSYTNAEMGAWLRELGDLLRAHRRRC